MKEYSINGIINVSMYQSILDPDVTLDKESTNENEWKYFSVEEYKKLVILRSIIELKSLLEMLPEEWRCEYVEGSAEIRSNYSHNILDRLYFKVVNSSGIAEEVLQNYLASFLLNDWEDEFGAQYRIYEYIASNYTPRSFVDSSSGGIFWNAVVKRAARRYRKQANKGIADYSVHDAVYDACNGLGIYPPQWRDDNDLCDKRVYDELVLEIRQEIGIDW